MRRERISISSGGAVMLLCANILNWLFSHLAVVISHQKFNVVLISESFQFSLSSVTAVDSNLSDFQWINNSLFFTCCSLLSSAAVLLLTL